VRGKSYKAEVMTSGALIGTIRNLCGSRSFVELPLALHVLWNLINPIIACLLLSAKYLLALAFKLIIWWQFIQMFLQWLISGCSVCRAGADNALKVVLHTY
jgi:hypothetical protein